MTALKRTRRFEQISERLERRIRDQKLAAGTWLPSERDMMNEFGVGRTSVREALFHLQTIGLIELKPGTRARVAAPSAEAVFSSLAGSARHVLAAPAGVRHFQDAREFFESGLARDAARCATDADIGRLQEALNANRQAISDLRAFERTDVAFHFAIASIPGNPLYRSLYSAIIVWLIDQRHVTLNHPGQNLTAFAAHEVIFHAIAAHDSAGASQLMLDHLRQVGELYWKVQGQAS